MPAGTYRIRPGAPLRGTVEVPGDKSISHRALILAALAEGESRLEGLGTGDDVDRTLTALRALGVAVGHDGEVVVVRGVGLDGLTPPHGPIDCGNSGTTLRLLAGLLAGRGFRAVLRGDASLEARPMKRIVEPLRRMGAAIEGVERAGEVHAPLTLEGGRLQGIRYELPVPSAQVKSALLLAALRARGATELREPGASRDHTERLLRSLGVPVEAAPGRCALDPSTWDGRLAPIRWRLPGDTSSAAFLCVGAALLPGSELHVRSVGINSTRIGFIDVLRAMGANLRVESSVADEEPRGDLVAVASKLVATELRGALALRSLDEIPILAVAATQASGCSTLADLEELRHKESDRIAAMRKSLSRMGAEVAELRDGLRIQGPTPLRGGSFGFDGTEDHRVVMSLAIAALCATGPTELRGLRAANVSFPGFISTLQTLGAELTSVDET